MTELKPCPFCGSTRRLNMDHMADDYNEFWCVMCRNCDAYMESGISANDVILKWNRRVKE